MSPLLVSLSYTFVLNTMKTRIGGIGGIGGVGSIGGVGGIDDHSDYIDYPVISHISLFVTNSLSVLSFLITHWQIISICLLVCYILVVVYLRIRKRASARSTLTTQLSQLCKQRLVIDHASKPFPIDYLYHEITDELYRAR